MADLYAKMQDMIRNAAQVTVELVFPTRTSVQRGDIEKFRDGLEIRDLFNKVSNGFKDLMNPNPKNPYVKARLEKLLPNPKGYPYIYKISIVENFGDTAPTVFLSNGDGSVIEERIQWMTVCGVCGSDSIADSKYETDDGWCDMCDAYVDEQKSIDARNYNPLRKSIGEWVESIDGVRGNVGNLKSNSTKESANA